MSTTKTIRRGSPPRRKIQQRPKRKPKTSMIDSLIGKLPVSQEALRRAATVSILGLVAGAAAAGAIWFGVPRAVGVAVAEELGHAGFRLEHIEVRGAKRMDPMLVYTVAFRQYSRAMPLVDLNETRANLLRYGWIQDARVSRRLPDTLVIDLVERTPAAVWQRHGTLTLIDAKGVPLEPVNANAMPDLPLLIGDGANAEAPAYHALLDAAPALKPMVKAATWVGNRRWDLMFETGETLSLPEEDAPAALVKFAQLDGSRALLGKGWRAFDLRDPGVLRARRPEQDTAKAITDPAGGGAAKPAPLMAGAI